MTRLSKSLITLVVLGALLALGFGASVVFAAYDTGNDIASHAASGSITNAECTGCHGQKANQPSLDSATFSAHKKHLKSAFLRFQLMEDGCGTCHVSTDIEQGSGASVNKQVDAEFCATCHGEFATSVHGENLAAENPRGCTACHTDPAAIHGILSQDYPNPSFETTAPAYVSQFFTLSRAYCTKCHGGLPFYAVEETN